MDENKENEIWNLKRSRHCRRRRRRRCCCCYCCLTGLFVYWPWASRTRKVPLELPGNSSISSASLRSESNHQLTKTNQHNNTNSNDDDNNNNNNNDFLTCIRIQTLAKDTHIHPHPPTHTSYPQTHTRVRARTQTRTHARMHARTHAYGEPEITHSWAWGELSSVQT